MWFPLDFPTANEHFAQRTVTPHITTPRAAAVQIPFSWRTLDVNSTLDTTTSGQTSRTSTLARVHKRNLGFAVSPSSGLGFTALYNEEVATARNIPETGQWRVGGLSEEFQVREVVGRVSFELLSNTQFALGARSQSIRGDVLGNFSADSDERVVYAGSRLGFAAGVLINLKPLLLAARYETPVTGKVSIQGESKVSSAPGYTGTAAQIDLNDEFAVSAVYGKYAVTKNELASPVPSPDTTRSMTILPLGMAVDARIVPLGVVGGGLNWKVVSSFKVQLDLLQGASTASTDPQLLVASTVDAANVIKTDAARLGLAVEKGDWESQIFADYGTSQWTGTANNSKTVRKNSYWGIGLRAGVEL